MGKNNLYRLKPSETSSISTRILEGIGSVTPGEYGVSADQRLALQDGLERLDAASLAMTEAKAIYHAAVAERDRAHGDCTDAAASIVRTIAANPLVSPPMIAALGLAPRSTTRTKVTPRTPAALSAALLPTGEIRLSWSRSGNPQGVGFWVESRSGSGEWRFAGETTKAKLVLSGYAPGVATCFRVRASRNNVASRPSPVALVYPSAETPALRLAA